MRLLIIISCLVGLVVSVPRQSPFEANADPTTVPTTVPTTDVTTTAPTTTSPTTPTTTAPTPPPVGCQDKIFSCASCYETQICTNTAGGWKQVSQTTCTEDMPYCNKASGSCSTEPDQDCGGPDTSFLCLTQGLFPDSQNCSLYHSCNNLLSATKFGCAFGETYDPDAGRCIVDEQTKCNTPNCDKRNGVKVPIGNTHYFGVCIGGSVKTVARCEGEYKLNATSQVCEAICEMPGLMADFHDQTKYFHCSEMVITDSIPPLWVREHLDCPSGQQYDPESFLCVTPV